MHPRQVRIPTRLLLTGFVLFCVPLGGSGQQPSRSPAQPQVTPAPPRPQPAVQYRDARLSVSVEGQPLLRVLEEISQQGRVAILSDDTLREERVSIEFQNLPIEEGLRRMLQKYDAFFFYGVDREAPAQLQAVWVYPKGRGRGLAPVPPEDWASTRELQERLRDPDPETRARALEALVERRGLEATDAVLDALKDHDPQVRTRSLYAAMSGGLDLPTTSLHLALNDESPDVRFLALESLSLRGDPNLRALAELLLNDPSSHVQHKAREILRLLDATHRSRPPGQAPQHDPRR